jgi:hypothetical protein
LGKRLRFRLEADDASGGLACEIDAATDLLSFWIVDITEFHGDSRPRRRRLSLASEADARRCVAENLARLSGELSEATPVNFAQRRQPGPSRRKRAASANQAQAELFDFAAKRRQREIARVANELEKLREAILDFLAETREASFPNQLAASLMGLADRLALLLDEARICSERSNGYPRYHRAEAGAGRSGGDARAASSGAENGGDRAAYRRGRARLQ